MRRILIRAGLVLAAATAVVGTVAGAAVAATPNTYHDMSRTYMPPGNFNSVTAAVPDTYHDI